MPERTYVLTEGQMRRFERAAQRVEALLVTSGGRGASARPADARHHAHVRLTSLTRTGNLYPAKWWQYLSDADDWEEGGDCWVREANLQDLALDTYYWAKLEGPSAADGLGVFVVGAAAGASTKIGMLTADLPAGGSAGMDVWYWDGADYSDAADPVTVYDWVLPPGSTLPEGSRVVASRGADDGRWYAVAFDWCALCAGTPPGPCVPCGLDPIPETVHVTVSGSACDCMPDGTYALTYDGVGSWTTGDVEDCAGYAGGELYPTGFSMSGWCSGGDLEFTFGAVWRRASDGQLFSMTGFCLVGDPDHPENTCSPLHLVFTGFTCTADPVVNGDYADGSPCGTLDPVGGFIDLPGLSITLTL